MMTYRLLFHTAVTEIRLTLRNLGFRLFLLFITVLTSAVLLSAPGSSSLVSVVHVANNVLFFQFPLLAIVISPVITRHHSLSREWVWATRLDYPVLLIGQFIGLTVVFFIASLLPLLMMSFWLIPTILNWTTNLSALWTFGLMFILPVTFLEMCAVFSFACWFRNTALVIAVVTALDVLLWLGILTPAASLLTPLNHTLLTLHLDSVAGLGAEKPILVSLLLFYVFLGLGGVIVSIWGSSQIPSYGESRPQHPFVMVGMFVGFTGIFLTFWLYTLSVKQSIVPPPPLSSQINVWGVEVASHNGSISGAEISLQSEFTLRNTSDVSQNNLMLSLNTGQNFIEATVNEYSVSFKRTGETIEILLPSPLAPNGVLNVKMSYAGSPILLREDYSLQTSIQNDSPLSFQNPVQTYLDRNVAYLHRDGDWMAWPLSSRPHLSPDEVITLEVPNHFPVVSSGEIIEQTDTYIKYQWQGRLPQILLATAPYHTVEQSGNMIFLGRYSDKSSLDQAQVILALVETLESKIKLESDRRYTAVILPYAQEVVISGSIIGLPDSKARYSPDNNAWIYDLAQSVSRAWLMDRLSWPGEITSNGYLRDSEIVCEQPDETGHQKCKIISLGKYNLQAPNGRLVNKTGHGSLIDAISMLLALQLTEDFTGSDAFTQREYEIWVVRAGCTGAAFSASDNYQRARWIVSLHQIFNESDFDKMILVLTEKYPPGSLPITEDEFLQVAGNYDYITNIFELPLPCEMLTGNKP